MVSAVLLTFVFIGIFVKAACNQLRLMRNQQVGMKTKHDSVVLLHNGMPWDHKDLSTYNCSCPPGVCVGIVTLA